MQSVHQAYQANYGVVGTHSLKEKPSLPQVPMQKQPIQDSLELNRPAAAQLRFGARRTQSQLIEEFLKGEENLVETGKKLQAAINEYRENAKAVSGLQDVIELLDDVHQISDTGIGHGAPNRTLWERFQRQMTMAAKRGKDGAPIITGWYRDLDKMIEAFNAHTNVLNDLEIKYQALKREGILSRDEQANFERGLRTLKSERAKLAEQLRCKAFATATTRAFKSAGSRIDTFSEVGRGAMKIFTFKWGQIFKEGLWDSDEIRSAAIIARGSAQDARSYYKTLFEASGVMFSANITDKIKTLIFAPGGLKEQLAWAQAAYGDKADEKAILNQIDGYKGRANNMKNKL